jgi:site-specific DNA-methyltransferase (adenine-specific)
MALLLGVMHANYRPGAPARGLSISMPNTFSMSPGYVRRYIREHRLRPPDIDVFDLLDAKLARMHLPSTAATRGRAWQQDARDPVPRWLRENPAKLIFTSPPYLRVIKYGKYNWVRLWMLKQDPKDIDNRLVATESLQKYLDFMAQALRHLDQGVRDDGYVCLMIGDVRERETGEIINLADYVWEEAASALGWHRVAVITDQLPTQHKVSRIWKRSRGNATKTDRILLLSKAWNRHRKLPGLGPIRWSSCAAWA